MVNMIFAGFGGQGVLTAGLIVAKTAMDFGDNVTWIPSYGSEMRGGTANCNVKVSKEKISSPFVKEIDLLIAMNVPSVMKFMPLMNKGAVLIVNSTMVPKTYEFRKDIQVVAVPATELAKELENEKGANIAMLGALAFSGAAYDYNVISSGVEDFFALKGKKNPKNVAVLEESYKKSEFIQKVQ